MSDTEISARGSIVVGVDGSEPSARALRWAVEQGRSRSQPLLVVACWMFPPMLGPSPYQPPVSGEEMESGASHVIDETVAMAGLDDSSGVEWRKGVLAGAPAPVLAELSAEAELLVVGSRGRGGFKLSLIHI